VPTSGSIIAKVMKGSSRAVTVKEKEIECIPAHSFKVIRSKSISPRFLRTCEKKQDYPNHSAVIANYTESSSPSKIRNRISYSFSKDCTDICQIENDFYISSITNYSQKDALEKKKEKVGCEGIKQKVYYFRIGGPNMFYNPYKKK